MSTVQNKLKFGLIIVGLISLSFIPSSKAEGASLTVTFPKEGDSIVLGDILPIRWSAFGGSGSLTIDLLSGVDDLLIDRIAREINKFGGQYNFDVPADLSVGTQYKFKFFDDEGFTAYSDYFRIDSIYSPPFEVTFPLLADVVYTGKDFTITWLSNGSQGLFDIKLVKGIFEYLVEIIATTTSSSLKTLTFPLPFDTFPGADYSINFSNASGFSETSRMFSIRRGVKPVPVVEPPVTDAATSSDDTSTSTDMNSDQTDSTTTGDTSTGSDTTQTSDSSVSTKSTATDAQKTSKILIIASGINVRFIRVLNNLEGIADRIEARLKVLKNSQDLTEANELFDTAQSRLLSARASSDNLLIVVDSLIDFDSGSLSKARIISEIRRVRDQIVAAHAKLVEVVKAL